MENTNPVIINRLIYFIGGAMLYIVILIINRKKHKASEKKLLRKVSDAFAFQKNKAGKLEGTYKGKEIAVYYEEDTTFKVFKSNMIFKFYKSNTIFKVKTHFLNPSEFLKSKPQTFPVPCFSLYKKDEFGKKQSSFENSLGIFKKIDLDLNEKTKLNLQQLFCKKYFLYGVTALKVWAPNSKKSMLTHRGEVIFQLPKNIVEDIDSLKIAMDIVVDVAKQMDKMKMEK